MTNMTLHRKKSSYTILFFLVSAFFINSGFPSEEWAIAGQYLDSAHGSGGITGTGVNRQAMTGYAKANCAHCHEQHASVNNSEPDPVLDGTPSPYELFTLNFDSTVATNLYQVQDNICFRCHDGSNTVQDPSFQNKDYSETFGCGTTAGTLNILDTFNQLSYHNLQDIWTFVDGDGTNYPWFNTSSNPCSACHNPHIARRNQANPQDVTFSALSLPTDHTSLFTLSMDTTFSTNYEPPYCSTTANREPAASADAATGRANTIDYVTFCTDCHNSTNTIASTELGRNLQTIDWSTTGDKHGQRTMDGSVSLDLPYNQTVIQNYALSCLDCHEPHGSSNITLLRRRVNRLDLTGTITTSLPNPLGTGANNNNREMGYLCMRCHEEDTGTDPPRWRTVHHDLTGAPYIASGPCTACHNQSGPTRLPIACDKCHFHGSTDTYIPSQRAPTPRITF